MCACASSSITEPYCMLTELKWFNLKEMCSHSMLFQTWACVSVSASTVFQFIFLWVLCCSVFFLNSQLFVRQCQWFQRQYLPLVHTNPPIPLPFSFYPLIGLFWYPSFHPSMRSCIYCHFNNKGQVMQLRPRAHLAGVAFAFLSNLSLKGKWC